MDRPSFENIHGSVKTAQASSHLFEGAKLSFTKGLSETFQISHNFEFGNPSLYMFNATFVDLLPGTQSPRTILIGNMDTTQSFLARVIRNFGNLTTTAIFQQYTRQSQSQLVTQLEADYQGSDHYVSLKVGDPDIVNESGAWFFSYLQSFTRKFSLGGALRYEYSNGLEDAVTTVGGSYKNDDHWQANATFEGRITGLSNFNLSYLKKIHRTTNFFLDFEGQFFGESKVTGGYEANFQHATVRSQVNTAGEVYTFIERKLAPGISFKFGGSLDHKSNEQRYGFGFFIGGP